MSRMRNKIPSIQCPKCGGSGIVSLPIRLHETLAVVRHLPGLAIPEMLHLLGFIKQAALSKRLMTLMDLGLVRREPNGKAYKWYPSK